MRCEKRLKTTYVSTQILLATRHMNSCSKILSALSVNMIYSVGVLSNLYDTHSAAAATCLVGVFMYLIFARYQ